MTKRQLAVLRRFYNINERSCILIGGALTLAALIGTTGLALASTEEEPKIAAVSFVAAAEVHADAAAEEALTGIVQSSVPYQAGSASGGRVIRLLAQIGDRVSAGTPLAILDGAAADLRVQQAQGEANRAAAIASERAAAASRAVQMQAAGAMSEAERSALEADARAAKGALSAAQAGVGIARDEARQRIIRSPGPGIVAGRNIEIGGVAAPGQILFAIEGQGGRQILAAVPEKLASKLRNGMRVRYRSESSAGEARITGISPRVEDGGVIPVRLAIESGTPTPGAIVRLSLALGGDDKAIVRVPATAIQVRRDGTRYVYRIDNDQRAMRVPVSLIGLTGSDARVVAPLPIGTRIVAVGGAFVRHGQQILIAKPGT